MSLARRLVDVVTSMGASEPTELLEQLCRGAVELLDGLAAGYCVLDGDQLEVVAVWQLPPSLIGQRFALAGSALDAVPPGARAVVADAADYPALNTQVWGARRGALAVARTEAAGEVSGGLYIALDADVSLTDEQLDVLELLAAHAGVALHDAARFEAADLQRQQTEAALVELEAAKDLFLAVAGHELRTPLAVVRGFGDTLLHRWDDLPDADRREMIATMVARANGMAEMVEQLVRGSHAGAAGVEVALERFDLSARVRRVVAGIAGSSPAHPVRVDAPDEVEALGDPRTVEPVLGQLVENAVKYSPEGGPVDVSVAAEGGRAVLRVADRGVGIAAADLDRVFERFVRGEPVVPGGRAGGVGLGLWIVRRYVEAQHGTVSASPREGGGTVVEVSLPG